MKNNLKKARDLFSKGKYNDVLRLLEPLIFDYSESKTFFYLLGYSCLYSMDFHGADSYLTKLLRLDRGNLHGQLGMALIHLKREELKEAAADYLRIIEIHPKSKEAKRGLEYLKKSKETDRILNFFDNGKFVKLLPRESRKKPASIRLLQISAVIIAVFFAAGAAGYKMYGFFQKPDRIELSDISLDDIQKYESDEEGYLFLSENEIKQGLKNVFSYIDKYRDNLAQLEINKLLLSNASNEVKGKASVLEKILTEPKFNNFKDNFTYDQVIEFPALYENCFVVWTGRAANISITEEKISFDFLVGYEDGKILEGIVDAYLTFSTSVYQNMPVELLGKIESDGMNKFRLHVTGVHRLLPSGE